MSWQVEKLMKTQRSWAGASIAAGILAMTSSPAFAADDSTTSEIRRQIEAMKNDYETRLRELEQRLNKTADDAAAAKAAAAQSQGTPPSSANPAPSAPASAGAFNPAISAVLNGTYSQFRHDPAGARIPGFSNGPEFSLGDRGFSLGESEVSLSANVDQGLYGNVVLSFNRDDEVEVEEAYIQSLSLPWGFTVKGGRFFSGIGYLNQKHAHEWDFVDAPLPYVAMLGNQYRDEGVQVRWLAPAPIFVEFGGEAFRGGTFPGASAAHGKSAHSAFVHFGDDINESSSWQAGLSYLHTEARGRDADGDEAGLFTGNDDLGIASLVYKWAPDGNPTERNLSIAGEYFFRKEAGTFDGTSFSTDQSGWYVQGIYQFMPRWKAGLRYDTVNSGDIVSSLAGTELDNQGHTPRRASALVEFDTSEFGRIRLQYSRDDSMQRTNDMLMLQYTVIFGPHGAHLF
jgi:hypothetical protein